MDFLPVPNTFFGHALENPAQPCATETLDHVPH